MPRARIVDVSELEPPQPMQVALENLRTLADGEYLVLQHRREPYPLYAMLAEIGFCYRARKGARTAIEVLIWARDADEPPESNG